MCSNIPLRLVLFVCCIVSATSQSTPSASSACFSYPQAHQCWKQTTYDASICGGMELKKCWDASSNSGFICEEFSSCGASCDSTSSCDDTTNTDSSETTGSDGLCVDPVLQVAWQVDGW